MSRAPEVSVVVPTHNRGALLVRAVEAILSQTAADLEVIVVNDGSTDDTRDRLAALSAADTRVRHVHLTGSGRPAVARNAGIRAAQGALVAFCDDDDIWYPHKLEVQTGHFARHGECALVSARCRWFGGEERVWPELDAMDPSYANLVRGNFIPCSFTVVRRVVLERLRGFDESPELTFCEDWDLWLRIAQSHAFRVLPDILGDYFVHAGGGSRKRVDALLGVLAVLDHLGLRDPALARSLSPRKRAVRRDLARELWRTGRWARAWAARVGLAVR